jgi:glycosyltransferase involved in cell wall biosynthesis
MRILFVTNNFPNPLEPTRGMFNAYTARALARAHDVRVISQISWRDEAARRDVTTALPRVRMQDGIEVHHPRYYYPPGVARQAYSWFLWQSVRSTVRRVLAGFTPDVVLGFWVHPDGDIALRIARQAGVPGIVMAGGSDVLVLGRDEARRRCIADVLRRADSVIGVSRHLKSAVEALGVPAERVHVVRNGVDPSRFSPGDRLAARIRLGLDPAAPTLLWVGRMVPVKGLDILLEAFAQSHPGAAGSALCLVGDGPLRHALAARARALGISDRVRFAGNVSHDDLPDYYRAADYTVLPSRSEGSPNALIESTACGTPFIASDVGGVPDLADAGLDCLVPAEDVAALADAIHDRLWRPRIRRSRSQPYTWDDHGAAMAAVFTQAIAARRAASARSGVTAPRGSGFERAALAPAGAPEVR